MWYAHLIEKPAFQGTVSIAHNAGRYPLLSLGVHTFESEPCRRLHPDIGEPTIPQACIAVLRAIIMSPVFSFTFLGFGENALKEQRTIGEFVTSKIPARLLLKRDKMSGKVMAPASLLQSSLLKFTLFATLESNPTELSNDTLKDTLRKSSRRALRTLVLPRR